MRNIFKMQLLLHFLLSVSWWVVIYQLIAWVRCCIQCKVQQDLLSVHDADAECVFVCVNRLRRIFCNNIKTPYRYCYCYCTLHAAAPLHCCSRDCCDCDVRFLNDNCSCHIYLLLRTILYIRFKYDLKILLLFANANLHHNHLGYKIIKCSNNHKLNTPHVL